jgi:hypothetical protein
LSSFSVQEDEKENEKETRKEPKRRTLNASVPRLQINALCARSSFESDGETTTTTTTASRCSTKK